MAKQLFLPRPLDLVCSVRLVRTDINLKYCILCNNFGYIYMHIINLKCCQRYIDCGNTGRSGLCFPFWHGIKSRIMFVELVHIYEMILKSGCAMF